MCDLNIKLEKLNLSENDTLVMRIPTDEDGCICVAYDEVLDYFKAVKNNVDCKTVIALPNNYAFEVMDDDALRVYIQNLNKELEGRK